MLGITLFEVVFNDSVTDVWNAVCKIRCHGQEFWTNVCENVTTIASWKQSFVANIGATDGIQSTIVIDIEKCNTVHRNTPIGRSTIDIGKDTSNHGVQKLPVFSISGSKIIGYISIKLWNQSDRGVASVDNTGNYNFTYAEENDNYSTSQAYHLRIDILRLEGLPDQFVNPFVTCEFRNVRLKTNVIQTHEGGTSIDTGAIKSYIFHQSFSFYALDHISASDLIILKLFASENSLLSVCTEIAVGVLSYNLIKVQPITPFWFNLYTDLDGEKIFYGRLLISGKCVRVNQLGDAKIVAAPFYNLPASSQLNIFIDLYRIITSFYDQKLIFEAKCGSCVKRIELNTDKADLTNRVVLSINLPMNKNVLNTFKSDYYLEFRIFDKNQLIAYKFNKLKQFFKWQPFTIKANKSSKFDFLSILMGIEMIGTGLSSPMRIRIVKRPFVYRLQIVSAKVNPPTYLNALHFNLGMSGVIKTTSQITTTSSHPLILQTAAENSNVDVRELSNGYRLLYPSPINIQLVKHVGSKKTTYDGVLELSSDNFGGKVTLGDDWKVLVNFNLIPNGKSIPIWQPSFKQLSFIISLHRILIYNTKSEFSVDNGIYLLQFYGQKFEFVDPTSKIFKIYCNYPINTFKNINGKDASGEKINIIITKSHNKLNAEDGRILTFLVSLKGVENICPPLTENVTKNENKSNYVQKNTLPVSIAQGFEGLPIGPDGNVCNFKGACVKGVETNVMIPKNFLFISGIDGNQLDFTLPKTVDTIAPLPYDTANIYECLGDGTSKKVGKAKFFTTIMEKGSIISGGKYTSDNALEDFSSSSKTPAILSLIINRALSIPLPVDDVAIEFSLGDLREIVKVESKSDCGMNIQLNLFWQQQLVVFNTPYLSISVLSEKEKVSGVLDLEDLWYSPVTNKCQTLQLYPGGNLEIEYELVPKETKPTLVPPVSLKSKYELRLVVWSVTNVPQGAIDGFVGVRLYCSDYEGKNDASQSTDLHYNCGNDVAIFNWRFVFPSIIYPCSSSLLQISFLGFKALSKPTLIGEYNWNLLPLLEKITASGHSMQEDLTISLGSCKVQVSMDLMNQAEANVRPVGLGRNEPNVDPKLAVPSQGRAWKDVISSAESSLGISLGIDLSSFYFYMRIGFMVIIFIVLIIIAFVYPAIFT